MTQQNSSGFVLWLTGLSGSGKTTLAVLLEEELRQRGLKVERLDGDIVRQGLSQDLGFSPEDRRRHIERVTFVARLLSRNGVAVICAFITPYQRMRDHARANTTNFIEVFVDAPLDTVIDRDVKGLYARALAGDIPDFTGVSAPFEAPERPDIHVRTEFQSPLESTGYILGRLEDAGLIPPADVG